MAGLLHELQFLPVKLTTKSCGSAPGRYAKLVTLLRSALLVTNASHIDMDSVLRLNHPQCEHQPPG